MGVFVAYILHQTGSLMGVILLSTGINLNDYLDRPKHVGHEDFLIMTVSNSISNSVQ
jgi:hypothetical protein